MLPEKVLPVVVCSAFLGGLGESPALKDVKTHWQIKEPEQ